MTLKDTEIGKLMALLLDKPEIPLRFYLEGISINQGYHVTEVKHASIKSMDCGRRADAWEEITIQLLDGEANSVRGFMSTTKFTSILRATLNSFSENSTPVLFFEFTPNNGPLQKLRIKSVESDDQELSIHLVCEKAACKPFQRWRETGSEFDNLSAKNMMPSCCSSSTVCCG